MVADLRPALVILLILTVITGLVYPLTVTAIAQLLMPYQANGSMIVDKGQVRGSTLIGQPFDDPRYFWGRLSATRPFPYNAGSSSGSNLGPLNEALVDAARGRLQALKLADQGNTAPVPVDLVTASASGLDPHISVAAAMYQVSRVARIRHQEESKVRALVDRLTEGRQLGILGEPRINILELNFALDRLP